MPGHSEDNYWRRTRLGRRGFVMGAGVAGAGAAALGLVGCGGDDAKPTATASTGAGGSATAATSATASPAAAQPKKGGEMVLGLGVPTTQSLDPHKTLNLGFSYYGYFLSRMISAESQKIVPYQGELVESWEQPDKSTYTFKVRKGVTWHDGKVPNGRALTAGDIAFTLMRIAGKTDPTRAALYQRSTNLTGMEKAEAVDANTVKITFSSPNSGFLAGVADWRNWVIAQETVDKDPDFKDPKNWGGTGPFIIDGWDSTTVAGRYVANPKYWKPGKPYLASVQQISLPDPAATLSAFLSGKTDFTATVSAETRAQVVKSRPEAKIYNWENLLWDYFGMNQSRAPFTDVRVRQAIFKALDYTSLMDQNYGKGFWDYTSVLLSGLPGAPSAGDVAKQSPWNPATKAQDVTDAKKLLEAAGFPDGKGMSFKIEPIANTGGYYDHAVRVQDQLQKLFPQIKLEITVPVDGAASARDLGTGNYDFFVYTAAPPPDTIFDVGQRLRTGGSRNYTKFSDPEIDKLTDQIFAEFDLPARAKLLDTLRLRILDTILNLPLGKITQSLAGQSRMQGFQKQGPGSSLYAYEAVQVSDSLWIA